MSLRPGFRSRRPLPRLSRCRKHKEHHLGDTIGCRAIGWPAPAILNGRLRKGFSIAHARLSSCSGAAHKDAALNNGDSGHCSLRTYR